MIYLDYSATTPVNSEVLDTYVEVTKKYIGNTNSIHSLGSKSNQLLNVAKSQIAKLLNVKNSEIIFTSGASESNNLAIKGICDYYKNRGNHIITTYLEHSSISNTINCMANNGFNISYVKTNEDGLIDINDLKQSITDKTILVSINYVNSEIGIKQNIDEIGKLLKKYPKLYFHVDGTQAIGKISINLDNIDLFSFSGHKIFAPKGIGCLIKKEKINLVPLIHGGKSDSIYRSGTPALPLIVSLSKAIRLELNYLDKKNNHVKLLNNMIRENLEKYDNIVINSNKYSIPHILNISLLNIKPETFIHAMEQDNIFISTKSACSNVNEPSKALKSLNKNDQVSTTSIRISISHLTTIDEINEFNKIFDKNYNYLYKRNNNRMEE